MGLLDGLLGGGQGRDRDDYDDFVRRYEDGPPDTGYDEREAADRYGRVSQHLSRSDYERSARASVERMSPQQRRQLGRQLRERVPDFDRDGDDRDDRYEDSGTLAGMLGGVHERQPGVLGGLLGGGGGQPRRGDRDGDGIPDREERGRSGRPRRGDRDGDGVPDRQERGGGGGGLLGGGGGGGDTLMKMALGGIAAMAVKQVVDRR